jgi:hypothetical protein
VEKVKKMSATSFLLLMNMCGLSTTYTVFNGPQVLVR